MHTTPEKMSQKGQETEVEIPPPVVGDRFWIQFEKVENRFGTSMPACLGATALEVTRKKATKTTKKKNEHTPALYDVKVIFDDNNTNSTQVIEFPSKNVYRLTTKPSVDTSDNNDNKTSLLYYAQACHSSQKESPWSRIAYDACPQEVHLGDLVDCHYQNGGYRDGWFRGRVASVSTDKTTCDVAYDDGKFECGIPIQQGNIRLLEKGTERCRWLLELPVEIEVQPRERKAKNKDNANTVLKEGRIEQVRPEDGKFFFKVDICSKMERPYGEIEALVMDVERRKSFDGEKMYLWPGISYHVGDIVYALFQKGKPDIWYRGRIAAIHEDEDDGVETKRFDVCYDDIDFYECGVPSECLRLFKQHCVGAESWVSGLEVRKKGRGNKRNGKVESKSSEPFEVQFSDGKFESWTYIEVTTAWFAAQQSKKKVKKFPGQRGKKKNQNIVQRPKEKEVEEEKKIAASADDQGQNQHDDSNNHDQLMSQDDDASFDFDDDDDDDDDETNMEFEEMNQPVANSLWRALNSSEPHAGAGILSHITTFHKKVPNKNFCQNLSDLMTHGPKSEGVAFMDPNRVEVAYNYFQSLSSNASIMDAVSENMTPTSWHDFEVALNQASSQEVYRVKGDSSRMNLSALRRIGESLQVAACSVEFILAQFQHQLKGHVEQQNEKSEGGSYKSKAVIKLVLENNIRDVLKKIARIYAQSWIQNGHFIISDAALLDLVQDTPETNSAIQVCAEEANRCLKALGKVTSYIAWLYCAEEGVQQGSDSCAFLIRDAILLELDTFDPSPYLPPAKGWKKESQIKLYLKSLKIRFAIGLQDDFASPLRDTIAKMLEVSKQVGILSV